MPATQGSRKARKSRWSVGIASAVSLLAALWAAPGPAPAAIVPIPALETTITAGPAEGAEIEEERPSFAFAATIADAPFPAATFSCSVDDAPAEPCTSPFEAGPLEEGGHRFAVFAEDAQQFLADPTPAERSFSIVSAEEECEVFEDEEGFAENDEECEEEMAEDGLVPPAECLLRTARARLFTFSTQNRVRLVIRYTAFAPADVSVDYRLSGNRGSLKLGAAHQRFAKRGLFRVNERLTDAEMDRVRAARRFIVLIDVPAAPAYCDRYDTRHLTVRRTVHNQVVWFQSDSIFGG